MTKPRKKDTQKPLCFGLRVMPGDWTFVQQAAAAERMSINTWLVRVSLAAARRRVAKANA